MAFIFFSNKNEMNVWIYSIVAVLVGARCIDVSIICTTSTNLNIIIFQTIIIRRSFIAIPVQGTGNWLKKTNILSYIHTHLNIFLLLFNVNFF